MTSTSFKSRLAVHNQSYKYRETNQTTLSRHIWKLKDSNTEYKVSYKIVERGNPYSPKTGGCGLCLKEKTFIITRPEECTLNKRNELIAKCPHRDKFLLAKVKD